MKYVPPKLIFNRRQIATYAGWLGLTPEEFCKRHNVIESPELPSHRLP